MTTSTLQECLDRIAAIEHRLARLESLVTHGGLELHNLGVAAPAGDAEIRVEQDHVVHGGSGNDECAFPDLILNFDDEAHTRKPPEKIEARAALEEFPRVLARIRFFWGGSQCEQFLAKLIIDERGNRLGFPMEVMSELMFLARISRILSPPRVTDIWEDQVSLNRGAALPPGGGLALKAAGSR